MCSRTTYVKPTASQTPSNCPYVRMMLELGVSRDTHVSLIILGLFSASACLESLAGHDLEQLGVTVPLVLGGDLEQLALPPSYERRPTGCSPARKPTDTEFARSARPQDAGQ